VVALDGVVIKIIRYTRSYRFARRFYYSFYSLRCFVLVIQIFIETLNCWFSWIYFIIKTEVFIFIIFYWILCYHINVLFLWIFRNRSELCRHKFLINQMFNVFINSYRDLDFPEWLRIMIETFFNWCQWLNWLMINILDIRDIIKACYPCFSFPFNKSIHLNKNYSDKMILIL
jgi:hypothetical protein